MMYDLIVDRYVDPQYYALLLAHISSKNIHTCSNLILFSNYSYTRSHALFGSAVGLNFQNYLATSRWRKAFFTHYKHIYHFSHLASKSYDSYDQEIQSLAKSLYSSIINFEKNIICRGIEVGDLLIDGFSKNSSSN